MPQHQTTRLGRSRNISPRRSRSCKIKLLFPAWDGPQTIMVRFKCKRRSNSMRLTNTFLHAHTHKVVLSILHNSYRPLPRMLLIKLPPNPARSKGKNPPLRAVNIFRFVVRLVFGLTNVRIFLAFR